KKYTRAKYTDEHDFSIENYYLDDGFENLISEESQHNEMTRLLTDRERQLLNTKQFGVLVHEQSRVDAELEAVVTLLLIHIYIVTAVYHEHYF
ncbi:unnamed protein product, partial [Candidula unifasciata]